MDEAPEAPTPDMDEDEPSSPPPSALAVRPHVAAVRVAPGASVFANGVQRFRNNPPPPQLPAPPVFHNALERADERMIAPFEPAPVVPRDAMIVAPQEQRLEVYDRRNNIRANVRAAGSGLGRIDYLPGFRGVEPPSELIPTAAGVMRQFNEANAKRGGELMGEVQGLPRRRVVPAPFAALPPQIPFAPGQAPRIDLLDL